MALDAVDQLKLRSTILDGEIVALDGEGVPRFQLLQQWQKRPRPLRLFIFCSIGFGAMDPIFPDAGSSLWKKELDPYRQPRRSITHFGVHSADFSSYRVETRSATGPLCEIGRVEASEARPDRSRVQDDPVFAATHPERSAPPFAQAWRRDNSVPRH